METQREKEAISPTEPLEVWELGRGLELLESPVAF